MNLATLLLFASLGQQAPSFSANTTDGKELAFPKSYAGKVVLVQFWATWCAPCRAEIPHVKKAFGDHGKNGFDVLGVSLDTDIQTITAFTSRNGMPWNQVCEGTQFDSTLAQMYRVKSIPALFLVDADTGQILASGESLRGPGMSKTIERELQKKQRRGS